jgi:hypothetical protein
MKIWQDGSELLVFWCDDGDFVAFYAAIEERLDALGDR